MYGKLPFKRVVKSLHLTQASYVRSGGLAVNGGKCQPNETAWDLLEK
jgi:hypothetical protein